MSDLASYANLINQQTQANNTWSAQQAQKQMDFQERMSNTAHVREVADLKAAGLNPVLSANSGASTPSGAMAETSGANITALADIAMQLANAENAKAIAEMKEANANARTIAKMTNSASSAGHYKDPMQDLLWQTILELTGNGGKSAQEIAQDAAKNAKSVANQVYDKFKDFGNAVYQTAINPKREATYPVTVKGQTSAKGIVATIKQGIKNRAAYATPTSLVGRAQASYNAKKNNKKVS